MPSASGSVPARQPAALERAEPCEVWGGEIFRQGAIIACKRPRGGRPGPGPMPAKATAAAQRPIEEIMHPFTLQQHRGAARPGPGPYPGARP